MTVEELIHELNKYPSDMNVFMAERRTEFSFGLVNSVRQQDVLFSENPYYIDEDDELSATEAVVVIDEE